MADRLAELDLPEGKTWTVDAMLPGVGGDAAGLPSFRARLFRSAAALRPRLPRGLSSDTAIVAGGLALALVCALFPWYIFLNQDRFGIEPVEFGGSKFSPHAGVGPVSEVAGARIPAAQREFLDLDAMSTGTVGDDGANAAPLSAQPFPGETRDFNLIYVANGRAMIADDSGYWVVQRGSGLPDGSRVASIEQRDGAWVLVTSLDTIIAIGKP